ncbi:hypothetical protein ORV05_10515 [Amycolatopsis cynarae]|uniref:LppX_LprAFG lipoprotein n=1 Tax=Amycolatopsis cynarae TaxID=2995223 RepID=A0ABY7BAL5_9PSEU|nr:hypothetical protein [Amycolatopsis sp. HUAS 11-8]WAL68173.1 hypothetical protein ORV05_10515 [Amycolatopsis sp. HUAS 11-8]
MIRRHLRALAFVAAAATAATAASCSATTATPPASAPSSPAAMSAAAVKAALTGDQVGSTVVSAYKQASAVHVKGAMTDQGSTVKIDLQLNQDSAGGTVETDGTLVPVVRVGQVVYVQVASSMLQKLGVSPTSQLGGLMKDKWVSSDSKLGDGVAANFKDFLAYGGFVDNTVGQMRSAIFTDGGTDTVNGTSALVFRSPEGVAYVAASEPHYLLRMTDEKNVTLDFTGWNQPVAVTAPPAKDIYSGPGA